MSPTETNRLIIFVHRNKIFFCRAHQDQSFELQLTTDIIKDLEVINTYKLDKALTKIIDESGLKSAQVTIILNKSTYFHKSLESTIKDPLEQEAQIEKFSELIPFDDIFIKQFKFGKKLEVVAINRGFYEPILNSLKKLNLNVSMILPDLVIKGMVEGENCTTKEGLAILSAVPKFTNYNLLDIKPKKTILRIEKDAPAPEDRKRLVILSVVFGLLIIVLIFALIFNYNRAQQDKKLINQQQQNQTAQPPSSIISNTNDNKSATDSAQADLKEKEATEETIDFDIYEIRVLNGSGITGQAGIVKEGLEDAGFDNITVGNAKTITSGKTSVIFSPSVPSSVRAIILESIESIGQEYTIQENDQIDYDSVITTSANN
ncbi:MAG: LytR C-terminal domain-containing protein [Candidatus Pacebacteria bacterium]|nr:LytR C-terminal domain-containing protein [Candidatus Paceibacterota bacterium]